MTLTMTKRQWMHRKERQKPQPQQKWQAFRRAVQQCFGIRCCLLGPHLHRYRRRHRHCQETRMHRRFCRRDASACSSAPPFSAPRPSSCRTLPVAGLPSICAPASTGEAQKTCHDARSRHTKPLVLRYPTSFPPSTSLPTVSLCCFSSASLHGDIRSCTSSHVINTQTLECGSMPRRPHEETNERLTSFVEQPPHPFSLARVSLHGLSSPAPPLRASQPRSPLSSSPPCLQNMQERRGKG